VKGFAATPRQIQSAPIVPLKAGQPPAWVVMCLDCGWSHDAHGLGADDAVKALAPQHQEGHHLIARAIDYTTGWGPERNQPHPLYSG
jgi:hypothetical protein